jgi:hypothetical protein
MSRETESTAAEKPAGAGRWIFGGIMTLIGIYGLFAAANARDTGFYLFGLLLFLFAVLFVFSMIHKYTGGSNGH